ncbi:recombinase family protein [Aminobacter niigataensis]|uniref:recombinase family protein n=1 Tax=Aminobacter niigataensis TaxID=83265 RepID=UPI0031B5AABB
MRITVAAPPMAPQRMNPMSKRAALYARYSSDLQTDRSIEDQLNLCRSYAVKQGHDIVAEFHDHAKSGASIMGRDALLGMMDAARDGAFDVLVVEALDRISRDQEDLAGIFKRLTHEGVEICAVHDGRADIIQIGIRGLVGALFLQDLAHKVRRGLAGVVRDGRNAGGKAYGYKPVLGKPGELEIVEAEAEVVRRIYEEYAAGAPPRDIAGRLNRDGIVAPRGNDWQASTINGNMKRFNGILQNPIYDGRIIWNRVSMVKDPDTGRRISRPNPESAWQEVPAPHLRIVPAELFQAVVELKSHYRPFSKTMKRNPKRLLSGLLRCGACGGGMSIHGKMGRVTRIKCTKATEARTCGNRRPYVLEDIEAGVISGLQQRLSDRRSVEYYVTVYNAEQQRLSAGDGAEREKAAQRLAAVNKSFQRAADLAIDGVLSADEAKVRLDELRVERAEIEKKLETMPEPPNVIQLKPALINRYLRIVETLAASLRGNDELTDDIKATVRELISKVTVYPTSSGQPPEIEVEGFLSKFVEDAPEQNLKIRGGVMVAGSGLEPPTPGL